MASKMKNIVLALTVVGLLIVGLGLFVGSTAGTSSSPSVAGVVSGAAAASTSSPGTFNFSSSGPVWDTGNLCVVQVSGAFWTCNYSGESYHHWGDQPAGAVTSDCGCSSPSSLIYNFSISHDTLNISLSGLSSKVPIFINIEGSHNTININVTGCRPGGILNVSVLDEFDQVNFVNSASGVSASFAIYENHDGFSAQISGSSDKTSTIFAGAAPKHNLCPWNNATRNFMTWSVTMTGWRDSQSLVWASGQGYNTAPNRVSVGHFDTITFENTSSFSCYWSLPAPSTCHHGSGWQPVLVATPRD